MEAHRRRDYSAALLSGYARQLRNIQSLRQSSTHALVTLVNRLPRLDLMEPVFKRCETDSGLRRTVAEALAGNTGASALLRKRPAVVARAAGEAVAGLASRAGSGTR